MDPTKLIGLLDLSSFIQSDKDGSRTLTAQEIIDFLDSKGHKLDENEMQDIRRWVNIADRTGDGSVGAQEFIAFVKKIGVFRKYDKDRTGFITKDEIQQGVSELGAGVEMEEMLMKCDTNGDGKINYEEFILLLLAMDPKLSGLPEGIDPHEQVKLFLQSDKDHSETVTAQEIIDFLDSVGLKQAEKEKQEIRRWVKIVDKNGDGDGAVCADEYLNLMGKIQYMKMHFDKARVYCFQLLMDGSGFITRDELRQVMMGYEDSAEIEELVMACDANGDGKVNYEEFLENFHN
ncbi:CALML5 [Branchiostoma lanceolatum]|uniref:CALML5 protein n=1 Tax=Branchiostoma lanceolatum TaxID=7740 RepID=A0A8J9Z0M0_BRALA|nr:CALML5 [Branchiostoma lanceolatum]